VNQVLDREDVISLQKSLSQQGYNIADESALVSSVKCEDDKNIAVIVLIPFTKDGATIAAHITSWKGNWDSKDLEGAIAIVESAQDVVYSYNEKKEVVSESKGNWSKKAKIPFETFDGFALPLATKEDVTESTAQRTQLPEGNSSIQLLATTYCKTVDIARTGYTILGFVDYKFHKRKYWCYNGSAVSNVNVSVYLSNMDPLHFYRGIVAQWDIPYATSHDSMRQGQIDNCISTYGCISTTYPAVQIVAYANGSYGYSTWQ